MAGPLIGLPSGCAWCSSITPTPSAPRSIRSGRCRWSAASTSSGWRRRRRRRASSRLVIWHSGKLRSRQTAEAFWKACNPFAELKATRGLQPSDGPWLFRDVLAEEERDLLAVGHMPSLPRILGLLTREARTGFGFPLHGVVALTRTTGTLWTEEWRLP